MEFDLIRSTRLATSFLTLLPVCPKGKINDEEFGRSIIYFSLVGVIIGLFNLGFLHFAQYLSSVSFNLDSLISNIASSFPWIIQMGLALPAKSLTIGFDLMNPWLISLGLVLINICLTGGLHLDGLMDCFDGIACGKSNRKDILEVMKDSRVGAFGSMAGSIAIFTQIICLAQLDYQNDFAWIGLVVLLAPALSRLIMVVAIIFQVKAQSNSSLAIFKKYQKPIIDIVINLVWIKLAALIYIKQISFSFDQLIQLDLVIIPWMIASWFVYKWLHLKLKGHNGDSMGAGLVLAESLWWFILAIA